MYKIDETVAITDFREFYAKHNRKPIEDEKILEQYPDVIEAIKLGNLDLTGTQPMYNLAKPVLNDDGGNDTMAVVFKTRILPSEQRSISKGIDVAKDKLFFVHKCYAHIIGQPVQMLDKFSKEDYAVVEQVSALFI